MAKNKTERTWKHACIISSMSFYLDNNDTVTRCLASFILIMKHYHLMVFEVLNFNIRFISFYLSVTKKKRKRLRKQIKRKDYIESRFINTCVLVSI